MSFTIDLDGRCALVTGAGQGVGLGIGLALAEAGALVAVNDIRPEQATHAVEMIRSAGGKAEPLPFDVTDWQEVSGALADFGSVDVLVNNAGNAGSEGFTDITNFVDSSPSDWERFFAVNLYGVMNCTHAVLPSMISGSWGRIITIISDAGRFGNAKLAPYAAAKAGAAGFCRSIAREVGRHAVTVNCVSLSTIETPTTERPPPQSPEERETRAEREKAALKPYVIRRRGTPDDVAGMVAYLASPLAEWITGQTYAVNGGYTFSL